MTKKFISIILSIIMCMCMISPVMVYADETEPKVIYRTSNECLSSSNCPFMWQMLCYDNGYINIDVYGRDSTSSTMGSLGYVVYNDTQIQYKNWYSEKSNLVHYVVSYEDMENVKYEVLVGQASCFYGTRIGYLELNISDEYLNCSHNMCVFGTDVTIPFGEKTYTEQLEEENKNLKEQISIFSSSVYGDVNGDQVVDVQDAQIILAYYTERDVAKKSVPDLVTFGFNFGKE